MTTGTALATIAGGNLPALIDTETAERMAGTLTDSKSKATIRVYRTAWVAWAGEALRYL